MSAATGTVRSVSLGSNPIIINSVSPLTIDTEFSQILTGNVKQFLLKARGRRVKIQLSFTPGSSGTSFLTIEKGGVFSIDNINAISPTLYMQVNEISTIIEIQYWT